MFAKICIAVLAAHWLMLIKHALTHVGVAPKALTKNQSIFVAIILSMEIGLMIYVASQVR